VRFPWKQRPHNAISATYHFGSEAGHAKVSADLNRQKRRTRCGADDKIDLSTNRLNDLSALGGDFLRDLRCGFPILEERGQLQGAISMSSMWKQKMPTSQRTGREQELLNALRGYGVIQWAAGRFTHE
jgi:hypothetical protein